MTGRMKLVFALIAFLTLMVTSATVAAVVGGDEDTDSAVAVSSIGDDDEDSSDFSDSSTNSELYDRCDNGDMQACDDLYYDSDLGSPEEEFGSTCGGTTDETEGGCVDQEEYDY